MTVRSQTAQRWEVLDNIQTAATVSGGRILRSLIAHPETATGRPAIWLQSFERKFSFFEFEHPVNVQHRRRESISLRERRDVGLRRCR